MRNELVTPLHSRRDHGPWPENGVHVMTAEKSSRGTLIKVDVLYNNFNIILSELAKFIVDSHFCRLHSTPAARVHLVSRQLS